MNKLEHAIEVLDLLDAEVGRSIYDQAVKTKNRRRLESSNTRHKRIKFPQSKYKKLYEQQKGICPWCLTGMLLLRNQVEIDHNDPNAKDFNADENLSVLHKDCNREKSAKTLIEQAEFLHITVTELIERFKR